MKNRASISRMSILFQDLGEGGAVIDSFVLKM